MNRNEFLKNLREALSQNLDKEFVNNQIDYYDGYISSEIEKGKSERDVIEELGDPRLIAKTIKTVNNADMPINDEDIYTNHDENANSSTYGNKKTYAYSTSGIGCVIAFLLAFIFIALFLRFFGYMLVGVTGLAFGISPAAILLFIIFLWLMLRRK